MAKNVATPLSKHLPKPELGLFVSGREKASVARASAAVEAHVSKDNLRPVADAERQLLKITRLYWRDKAYDEAASVAEVRDQIDSAVEKALATVEALRKFSKATKVAFVDQLRRQRPYEAEFIENMIVNLEKFTSIATPLTDVESESRSREALKNCCARLMELREEMTGATFKATLTPVLGVSNATEVFLRPDPQFVLEIAHAIDPNVNFSAVRSALITLAREQEKNNREK